MDTTELVGSIILSVVLIAGTFALICFQWNKSHVFNPTWHPHARFHAVQLTFFFIILSVVALWLVWQNSPRSSTITFVTALIPFTFWLGELLALLVPGTDPNQDLNHPNTFSLFGFKIHGNLLFSAVMIVLTFLGYMLSI